MCMHAGFCPENEEISASVQIWKILIPGKRRSKILNPNFKTDTIYTSLSTQNLMLFLFQDSLELGSASPFACADIKAQWMFLRLLPGLFDHSLLPFILQETEVTSNNGS